MSIFRKAEEKSNSEGAADQAAVALRALNSISDGVVIVDGNGMVKMVNPAAVALTGSTAAADVLGLSFLSLMRLETSDEKPVGDDNNPMMAAMVRGENWESREYLLVTMQGKKTPVAISVSCPRDTTDKVITFRDIEKERTEENEQMEFISTASHEMRTPVASIEGYLGLALNPQTATIDERAKQYLTEAHNASQHLGRLFRDLLDVTKLDDKRIKVQLVPVEMTEMVRSIAYGQIAAMEAKRLSYNFGDPRNSGTAQIDQLVYAMVDVDFLQEIINNLVENAIKYTPEGGAIYVNVQGQGENVLINVSDTGMGISPDNLTHIFQKFYRVDNSDTRTIGGTGLGLYIVKQRTEAMGGKVWAESEYGKGSTFWVSMPRISAEEFERQQMIQRNTQMMPIVPQEMVQTAIEATDMDNAKLDEMKRKFAEQFKNSGPAG